MAREGYVKFLKNDTETRRTREREATGGLEQRENGVIKLAISRHTKIFKLIIYRLCGWSMGELVIAN